MNGVTEFTVKDIKFANDEQNPLFLMLLAEFLEKHLAEYTCEWKMENK